jgi:chorismate-pyruvate lyase
MRRTLTTISLMSSSSSNPPRRERFADAAATPAQAAIERQVLRLLMAQDGSTTRLCEAVAGGPVELLLIKQHVTSEVPAIVREQLPGTQFIERITSLAAHGQVLMDNLTYIALDGLEPAIDADLRAGTLPIGHLLARLWVRRERITQADELTRTLWNAVGLPDEAATRAYRITTPTSARMLIAETYRRGMLMERA